MITIKRSCLILLFPILFLGNKVPIITFTQLQTYAANKTNDTLYVVNFWATWCEPCVKELPGFQQAYQRYYRKKVKMIFVSLNSVRDSAIVENFASSHDMVPVVVLLKGGNANDWINKIDSSWSGGMPATIMYKSGKKVYFREGEMNPDSLDSIIKIKNK